MEYNIYDLMDEFADENIALSPCGTADLRRIEELRATVASHERAALGRIFPALFHRARNTSEDASSTSALDMRWPMML